MKAGAVGHTELKSYTFENNTMRFGGVCLTDMLQRAGHTPFFAYSKDLIAARVSALRATLPAEIQLHYAVKANPLPELVNFMAGQVGGFDVASQREMEIALQSGMPASSISFAGPGKRDDELFAAVEAGIVIILESFNEMERLARICMKRGCRTQVAVRVNPDFELKSSGMKMSGGPKQFGVDAEQIPDLLKRLSALPLDFVGFHIFSGSQNLRAESIVDAHEKTFELALRLAEFAPAPVRLLNIGGGFGIPYFPGDLPLDVLPIADNLGQHLPTVRAQLPHAEVVIELGRYLVGEAGIYVCRVIDRKISRGQVFLVTDGGMHHHLAASGNLGQVIRKNYPVVVGTKSPQGSREIANVVGPLCTPLDTLAHQMDLAAAEVGDLIVILQSGAYGVTASPVNFLSHPAPAEIVV